MLPIKNEDVMRKKFTVYLLNDPGTAQLKIKQQNFGGKTKTFIIEQEALSFAEQNINLYHRVIIKDSNNKTIKEYLKGKPI